MVNLIPHDLNIGERKIQKILGYESSLKTTNDEVMKPPSSFPQEKVGPVIVTWCPFSSRDVPLDLFGRQ